MSEWKEYRKEDFEALSNLRSHPGWLVLVEMLREMRSNMDTIASVNTIEELHASKGWLECAELVLTLPDDAQARTEEYDHE